MPTITSKGYSNAMTWEVQSNDIRVLGRILGRFPYSRFHGLDRIVNITRTAIGAPRGAEIEDIEALLHVAVQECANPNT